MFLGILTLVIGIAISAVAIYYSVLGLVAIFAAATIPIMVMGGVLEVGKLVTAVWLHKYWNQAVWWLKTYLTIAVLVLMFITSMGIFGFLSKAHIEQTATAGDNSLQIELIDNRIAREQKRIQDADTVISQLDQAVQTLIDFDRIRGRDGAIAVREGQKEERDSLNAIITEAQNNIAQLQDQRLTLSKEQVAIEAEVGPIKYIAEFIYGSEADKNLLEEAVRWVIIIIIFVFDPLAVLLLIASQYTFDFVRKEKESKRQAELAAAAIDPPKEEPPVETPIEESTPEPEIKPHEAKSQEIIEEPEAVIEEQKSIVQEIEKEETPVVLDEDLEEEHEQEMTRAERAWKRANPDDTLKRHRRLFALGIITELPWESPEYAIHDAPDIDQKLTGNYQIMPELVNPATASEELTYFDREGFEQVKKTTLIEGYKQNEEQSDKTLWSKVKQKGEDE